MELYVEILASTIRYTVPLILACIAGLWSERSGIVDIGLEGKMLIAAFVAALILLGSVSRQFFPSSDRPELTVDLTLRQNASIFATEQQVKRLEDVLKADPDVDHFSSYVGRGAIRGHRRVNARAGGARPPGAVRRDDAGSRRAVGRGGGWAVGRRRRRHSRVSTQGRGELRNAGAGESQEQNYTDWKLHNPPAAPGLNVE